MGLLAVILAITALARVTAFSRPVTIAWDANPFYEYIIIYRAEIFDDISQGWVTLGEVDGAFNELLVPNFPDARSLVRVFALNLRGISDPSEVLIVEPDGLRLLVNGGTLQLDQDDPGKLITLYESHDLTNWKEIASAFNSLSITLPTPSRSFFFTTSQTVP